MKEWESLVGKSFLDHCIKTTNYCTLTIMNQNYRMIATMLSTVVVSCQGMWLQFLDYLHKRKEKEIRVGLLKKKKSLLVSSISSSGKNISFPLSPSTGSSLVGFSHLMFLPFLLHLRFFLSIFQIWVLSWAQNSPVYANQPSRLGAAEMCRTSDTLWDSSLWCWGLSTLFGKLLYSCCQKLLP